ncbi:MAG: 23S rRNA (guanosine(2251)-2'-O)-methyltransferase RlmB, partial [Treponema sp.]|nr:23S rRNA (guanosine(2251)-2'-O)-methyltransferase RlmB [Treponema sp.]
MIYLTGFHAIEERIKSGRACGPLLVAKAGPRAKEITSLAVQKKIRLERIGAFDLDGLAPNNRGIALQVDDESGDSVDISLDDFLANLENSQEQDALVLILDEI